MGDIIISASMPFTIGDKRTNNDFDELSGNLLKETNIITQNKAGHNL